MKKNYFKLAALSLALTTSFTINAQISSQQINQTVDANNSVNIDIDQNGSDDIRIEYLDTLITVDLAGLPIPIPGLPSSIDAPVTGIRARSLNGTEMFAPEDVQDVQGLLTVTTYPAMAIDSCTDGWNDASIEYNSGENPGATIKGVILAGQTDVQGNAQAIGEWLDVTNKFLPVRLVGSGYNYGWIQMDVSSLNGFNATVHSAAYNQTPGNDILTAEDGTFTCSTLSVDDYTLKANVFSYGKNIKIESNNVGSHQVQILDLTGKEVLNQTFDNGFQTVNASKLVEGVYVVRVSNQNSSVVKRIILK